MYIVLYRYMFCVSVLSAKFVLLEGFAFQFSSMCLECESRFVKRLCVSVCKHVCLVY